MNGLKNKWITDGYKKKTLIEFKFELQFEFLPPDPPRLLRDRVSKKWRGITERSSIMTSECATIPSLLPIMRHLPATLLAQGNV